MATSSWSAPSSALVIVVLILSVGITSVPVILARFVLVVAMALHLALGLDGRAHRLPAAARLVPPGAADHRDRHVDRAAELRPDRAGRATRSRCADLIPGYMSFFAGRHFSGRSCNIRRLRHRRDDGRPDVDLLLLIARTPLGRAQRACEQDLKMAALLGVNVDRTISLTFVIGAALAAVAGLMYLLYYGVIDFYIGFVAGMKAFTAAVLGGIGSLPGAMLGGLPDRPDRDILVRLFLGRIQGRRGLLDPGHRARSSCPPACSAGRRSRRSDAWRQNLLYAAAKAESSPVVAALRDAGLCGPDHACPHRPDRRPRHRRRSRHLGFIQRWPLVFSIGDRLRRPFHSQYRRYGASRAHRSRASVVADLPKSLEFLRTFFIPAFVLLAFAYPFLPVFLPAA